MSSTPTISTSAPPAANEPLTSQYISSIERSLLTDPFSPLTRSRQERLLVVSFVSMLLFLGLVKGDKGAFAIFGTSFPAAVDTHTVKLFGALLTSYFLVAFLVGVRQDYLMRQGFKFDIQGRFEAVVQSFAVLKSDYETRCQAVAGELWTMMDDQVARARTPGRTDEQRNEQIAAIRERLPILFKEHFAENREKEVAFKGLENRFRHLLKGLNSYDGLRDLIMVFDAIVPAGFAVCVLVIWYFHRA